MSPYHKKSQDVVKHSKLFDEPASYSTNTAKLRVSPRKKKNQSEVRSFPKSSPRRSPRRITQARRSPRRAKALGAASLARRASPRRSLRMGSASEESECDKDLVERLKSEYDFDFKRCKPSSELEKSDLDRYSENTLKMFLRCMKKKGRSSLTDPVDRIETVRRMWMEDWDESKYNDKDFEKWMDEERVGVHNLKKLKGEYSSDFKSGKSVEELDVSGLPRYEVKALKDFLRLMKSKTKALLEDSQEMIKEIKRLCESNWDEEVPSLSPVGARARRASPVGARAGAAMGARASPRRASPVGARARRASPVGARAGAAMGARASPRRAGMGAGASAMGMGRTIEVEEEESEYVTPRVSPRRRSPPMAPRKRVSPRRRSPSVSPRKLFAEKTGASVTVSPREKEELRQNILRKLKRRV